MATWVLEKPQPLPVNATPQVSVSSSFPPAQLRTVTVVSLSWGLRQDCLPALEMYTIVVLAGADTNLEKVGKPAWQKRGHIAVQCCASAEGHLCDW